MADMDSVFHRGQKAPTPSHWMDTMDRAQSTSFSAKGLRNAPGENNCFLNSAVQVFWHLDVFRRSYRRLTGHLCMGNSCIFCALKVIFTQFQYSDQASLPPDALRKALAETFNYQQRFQLGHMDDAAECFENILRRIHFHIANAYSEDACQAAHCLPHAKFAMTVFDQLVCSCGASSEPLTFHELVHYISTNSLVSQCRSMHETGDILHPEKFGLLLRNAGAVGDVRDCPNSCGKRVQIRRTLLNCPDVVSIGLVWETDKPSPDMITEVAQAIGTTILFPDLFHSVMIKGMKNGANLPRLQLSAIVCYYGKHYSTFVYHTKLNVWIYFDDTTVREVGPHWEHVVDKCCKGHYQPLLLLYSNPSASPVPTETAPKKRVMAPGYATPSKGSSDARKSSGVTRPQTTADIAKHNVMADPSKSMNHGQSVNFDATSPDAEQGSAKKSVDHHRQPSFLIAVTGKNGKSGQSNGSSNHRSEYAVPMNNLPVKHRHPGGQVMESNDERGVNTGMPPRPNNLPLGDNVDGYHYTLSTSNQYRRPSISSPNQNKVPVTQSFSRVAEMQRKESFKKGNGKIPADVIRYVDPARPSSTSSSDSDSIGHNENHMNRPVSSARPDLSAPRLPPKHIRTRSVSCEESPQNLSADHIDMHQHTVMKPKPSITHNYENMDHTPVQSGLATLPRNKKGKPSTVTEKPSVSHSRQNSQITSPPLNFEACDKQPYPSHSRESSTHTLIDEHQHSRHSSITSQNSDPSHQCTNNSSHLHTSKPSNSSNNVHPNMEYQKSDLQNSSKSSSGSKPPKPVKPDKKSLKKRSGPVVPERKTQEPKPNSPEAEKYISRKMVENILTYQTQKLTRQSSNASSMSHCSNSSFDSDTSSLKSANSSVTTSDIQFDALSLESQRDSGYGSSDRNSSSSTGSTTLDPMTQYFLSKSMIPPKNFNPRPENIKSFIEAPSSSDHYGQTFTVAAQYSTHLIGQNSGYRQNDQRDKTSPELSENYKREGSSGTDRKQLYDPAIVKSHNDKGMPQYQSSMKTSPNPPTSRQEPNGATEEFHKLCMRAEECMDQCILVETSENGAMALKHCNAAIDCLKQAMKITTISQQSFVFAQKMHNSCVLKARSLQKRFVVRQESSSSTCSSDSARSSPCPLSEKQISNHSHSENHSHNGQNLYKNIESIHSRSSSRDSIDSVIENKNYRKENRTSPLCTNNSNQGRDSPLNNTDRSKCQNGASCHNVDIYATLPRKKKGKPGAVTTNNHVAETYSQGQHGRTPSSGSITPTPMDNCRDSDSSGHTEGSEHMQYQISSHQQVKSNRAEIRHLQNNTQYRFPPNSSSQGPHQDKVCTSVAPQHTVKSHPVLPPKPKWGTDHMSQVSQASNRGLDYTPHGEYATGSLGRKSSGSSAGSNLVRHTSFNGYQQPGSAQPARTLERCVTSGRKTPQLEQSYNHTDCSNAGPHSQGTPQVAPNTSNNNVSNQELYGHPSHSSRGNSRSVNSQQGRPMTPQGRPVTPQYGQPSNVQNVPNVSDGAVSEPEESRPSVRDLASRFEGSTEPTSTNHNTDYVDDSVSHGSLGRRHRSKSESDFRSMEVKPKSVLTRNKKNRNTRPRKSVTFSDNIALVESLDLFQQGTNDRTCGYVSDEEGRYSVMGGSYSDNECEDEDSTDSPTEIMAPGHVACSLCGKKGVIGHQYCDKCHAYLSQFQPKK